MPLAHPGPEYLFCYRPHRIFRSLKSTLPHGAKRALLWAGSPRNIDLFHSLNQRVDSSRYRRVVCTFHDLFVITSEYSTPDFRRRFTDQAREAANRSDMVIAVSQFTADQVEDLLKVDRARIRVVQHGISAPEYNPVDREKIILFVGALQKRKNVLRLLQAFEQTPPGWKLVLAGSTGYESEEILNAVTRSTRRASIELPGYVNPETLEQLYRTASIFAFPSLDEGFGMPVLEAMAHGLPVLTSNRSALPEISGNAALLVDPTQTSSIADGLNLLTENEALRLKMAQEGRIHSSKFTWAKAVDETWAVYKELLD